MTKLICKLEQFDKNMRTSNLKNIFFFVVPLKLHIHFLVLKKKKVIHFLFTNKYPHTYIT